MRDIIFRGRRVDNGEWVYGSMIAMDGDFFGSQVFIFPPHDSASSLPCSFLVGNNMVAVVPKTVGQYSGLTDKNGKKIFEGDLVSTDLARPYLIVEFRQGCFMYNCNDGENDYYDIMLPILDEEQTSDKYVEVIGNVHDHAELLKGGADNA